MDTPPIPLPCTYGDARVPIAIWRQIEETAQGCWVWSGTTSPTGSPVYRRKSVWRTIYNALCGGRAQDLPALCRSRCGAPKCVNPDHRVPPEDRIPVLSCPTCGQPTYEQHRPGLDIAPIPEKPPAIHPEIRRLEEGTQFGWSDVLEKAETTSGFDPNARIERHPNTIDYTVSDHYRLTGRVWSREGKPSQFEVRDEEGRTKWVVEERMSAPQQSDLFNRTDALERGNDSVFVVVSREERFQKSR